jgi:flagellin
MEDIMSNMVIRTNIMALNSHRNLGLVGLMQARASERLSSGFRINRAADDAAGLAISEGMRSQIRGMAQATRNTQDGISLIQTAEGFMNTITELAQRARELMVQGANDTNNDTQRLYIQNELRHVASEINRIWTTSTFNGAGLFEANPAGEHIFDGTFYLQIGPDGIPGHALEVVAYAPGIADVRTGAGAALGTIGTAIDAAVRDTATAADHAAFRAALETLDAFVVVVNTFRSDLGALQNRLEFTMENLDIARENLSASESRIRDADMALEMMRLTQANVLQQAATAMLAQGNMAPQSILQLLG